MTFDPDQYLEAPAPASDPGAFLAAAQTAPRSNPAPDARIAIIGMAGRFPGARNLAEFWANLREGRESITFFPESETELPPWAHTDTSDPHYVRAAGILEDADCFDAGFFGCSPREADYMDPQQRLFLECCWTALEHAGYNPRAAGVKVGVFAGTVYSTYLWMMLGEGVLARPAERMLATIGNLEDNLTTRVAYKLNLKGPAVTVQTACSSSLVAVNLACEQLLSGKCDLALAGGVAVVFPQKTGYLHNPDLIDSQDGHCRAFCKGSTGTIFSNGLGVVVLKRLDAALRDRDTIHAVILGSAVNNDGNDKIGYTAPSVSGQREVICQAFANANVPPESIGYIEAHGTGTPLGDPIEIAALTEAFRGANLPPQSRPIGSVKTNLGHLNTAAGVAGLIKVVLALKNREIPPSLHFEEANPELRLSETPFYVNAKSQPWRSGTHPRRACVSSFGIGGTNAHVILEEAPEAAAEARDEDWQPLAISGHTAGALKARLEGLKQWIEQGADVPMRDLAFTLNAGRAHLRFRAAFVCSSLATFAQRLGEAALQDSPGVRSDPGAPARLLEAARRYISGEEIDWREFYAPQTARRIPVPTTVFARERHWFQPKKPAPLERTAPPFLTRTGDSEFRANLRASDRQIAEHRVHGIPVLPGTAQIEMARSAFSLGFGQKVSRIRDIHWLRPLMFEGRELEILVRLTQARDSVIYQLISRAANSEAVHSEGEILATGVWEGGAPTALGELQARVSGEFDPRSLYQSFFSRGIEYGPYFQRISRIWRVAGGVLAEINLDRAGANELDVLALHPALLDAALQSTAALFTDAQRQSGQVFLPFSLAELQWHRPLPARAFVHARVRAGKPEADFRRFDLDMYDAEGAICVRIMDLCSKELKISAPSPGANIEQRIREHIAHTLQVDPEEIDPAQSHAEYGVDSVLAVEIVKSINDEFGTNLRATDLFSYSTIAQLGEHVRSLAPVETVRSAALLPAEPAFSPAATDIAVIGMAGRFPGADDLEQFWANLANGVDSISKPPPGRWTAALEARAGFLRGVDEFDPLFFKISPKEAECMDPQQRLFLQEAWRALEDAGCAANDLNNSSCGVFVGVGPSDYGERLLANAADLNGYAFTGNATSILAARISYFLNLKGPSLAIDTACSSSLVAVHLACQSLRQGECAMAIAGGVHVMATPRIHLLSAKAGMLSPTGACKTFDASADGMVLGEGVGVVVLKPLGRALEDGDPILGVIRGTGVNQDGKTNGITAPSALSQTGLELAVCERSKVSPESITLIEAHGTGTNLGDPIELHALADTFRKHTSRREFCAIGSVKTNIGHLMTAAGIAGLIKVLLCLRHRQIPASLHFTRPNEHFDFQGSPFYVSTKLHDWRSLDGQPLRAAVSAFGFSGTNAHVIVESAPERNRNSSEPRPEILAFSAPDEDSLRRVLEQTARWLESNPRVRLEDLAFTLNARRTHFEHRFATVAGDLSSAARELRRAFSALWVQDSKQRENSPRELVERVRNGSRDPGDLQALADFYRAGGEIPWAELYDRARHVCAHLPPYPFKRERYWIEERTNQASAAHSPPPADLVRTGFFHRPAWRKESRPRELATRPGSVLIIRAGRDNGLAEALAREHPETQSITVYFGRRFVPLSGQSIAIDPSSRADWDRLAASLPAVGVIYFLAEAETRCATGGEVNATQERGVMALFRLSQALRLHELRNPLDLKIVTFGFQKASDSDREISPWPGSLVGLAKVIDRECPAARVSIIDLPEREGREYARFIRAESVRAREHEVAYRSEGRWVKFLEPVELKSARPPFRERGTYLILGGAGGIGLELSGRLSERYKANLVLVGRRNLSAELRAKLDSIERLGGKVLYCQADGADLESMERVITEARSRFGVIHGMIHSALVLRDAALWKLDEEAFRQALEPKVMGSWNLAQLAARESLDFLAFFSSAASLFGNPGQANYVAGCAFKDALALSLAGRLACPVKVINWGFWGEVGAVAADSYRHRIEKKGIIPIRTGEGLDALDAILGSSETQVAAIKLTAEARAELKLEPVLDRFDGLTHRLQSLLNERGPGEDIPRALDALDAYGRERVHETLRAMGLPDGRWENREALCDRLRIAPRARRLFFALLESLDRLATPDGALEAPLPRPYLELLDACVAGLPAVLRGESNGADVLFPDGSPRLVEAVYSNNPVSDCLNALVAEAASSWIGAENERFGILEIGAGTGATSAHVLEKLSALGRPVEYHFTDISRTLLALAENKFAKRFPFVRFELLDIEKPPEAGTSFDLIIASNVLHATRRLKPVLDHVRRLLKPGGLLLLNELTSPRDYLLYTFGLTDGWWQFEDSDSRLPAGPLVSAGGWRALLTQCGFDKVQAVGIPRIGADLILGRGDLAPSPLSSAALRTPSSGQIIPYLADVFAQILKLNREAASRLSARSSFDQFGVDSLVSLELIARLEKDFGKLPKTLLFEHKNLESLAAYFQSNHAAAVRRLAGESTPAEAEQVPAAREEARESVVAASSEPGGRRPASDIAIIGISGRYPDAPNLEEFWRNLRDGRASISEIPRERWNHRDYDAETRKSNGGSYSRWGAFLNDIDKFDPLFFNISPREAELMDPQERLFLQTAWNTMEDAGYTRERLSFGWNKTGQRQNVGVFAGVMYGTYQLFGAEEWARGRYVNTSSGYWCIPNRVSYVLDLEGPSIAVDTACSSSLTAIHLACESLRRGECQLAFAGGVNLILHPSRYAQLCQVKMLSPDGACRPFGDGANGFVPGEGVGAVLLKPLEAALRDGDFVYAVIKGSAVNSGGKTSGFTVPNPIAQSSLVRAALERANLPAESISYIEAHGTGTSLGDPVEIAGLAKAFARDGSNGPRCAIGSVKSNIGHLEGAAGIAALTKVVLMLQAREIAPSLNARNLNPLIDFSKTSFHVQQSVEPWIRGDTPRRAGISSFGAGGANAHLIIEEAPGMAPRESTAHAREIVLLSARKPDRLREMAERLRDFVKRHPDARLADFAYTLQVGRESFEERLAFPARDVAEIATMLDEYLAGSNLGAGICAGNAVQARAGARLDDSEADRQFAHALYQSGQSQKLAAFWVTGSEIDWAGLRRGEDVRRIPVPGYAFARERCWFSDEQPAPAVRRALHPLLDSNESTLRETRFLKVFHREDEIARDHVVSGRMILPGAAHLEMARAAAALASGSDVTAISRVVWIRPILVESEPVRVFTTLIPKGEFVAFEIWSDQSGQRVVYSRGTIQPGPVPPEARRVDVGSLLERPARVLAGNMLYASFQEAGLNYGRAFQVVRELRIVGSEALARLKLDEGGPPDSRFVWPPALVDGALQSVAGLAGQSSNGSVFVPFALGKISAFAPAPPDCFALVRPVEGSNGQPGAQKFEIQILGGDGSVILRLEDCAFRPLAIPENDGASSSSNDDARLKTLLERIARGEISPEEASRHARVVAAAPVREPSISP